MPSSKYYKSLIHNISKRSVEATVSMLGIRDSNLRMHLTEQLNNYEKGTGFLADPVFEATFPWEKHHQKMSELSGNLLQESLVNVMDRADEQRFGKDWFPFKHQLKAWEQLLDKGSIKSAVITSGTGSGKTECFMVPILNDLVSEYEEIQEPLIGIRALFIYPLNALINSQRERLRAWTAGYDDGVRFCLYNGNTEELKHKEQSNNPNELLTRKGIRATPPPIMVTNATMLEYMLVRQIDSPIIEQSQGKLRWIVLDEAHSYIGSQAAELSLLLRRVLHSFNVKPEDVRFVATSATIGNKDADLKLQEYLANLAGVSRDQIVVIGGRRDIPKLSNQTSNRLTPQEIISIDEGNSLSETRFEQLSGSQDALKLRHALSSSGGPSTLSQLTQFVYGEQTRKKKQRLLELLDICSYTQQPGPNNHKPDIDSQPFLPLRSHLFHQVISGIWCCVDKNCAHKKETRLATAWPFGYVYTQRRTRCECGAPVYELVFCVDCNEPHLMAIINGDRLIQYDRESLDEFSLDAELSEEDSESELQVSEKVYISPQVNNELTYPISINIEDLSIQGLSAETIELNIINSEQYGVPACGCCGFERIPSPFRQCLLGTPFYISNTVPTLLEACQESEKANQLPARGRRLITFTDSRQGTARISTKIQQDSERDSIRGQVYKYVVSNSSNNEMSSVDEERIAEYEARIKKYEGTELASEYVYLRDEVLNKYNAKEDLKSISWHEMVAKLQSSPDVSTWMFDYYSDINPELFNGTVGARTLVEMVLLREFARRPKYKNSLETLGLVSVVYPALSEIKKVPPEWERLKLTSNDWVDFLKVTLDFYVRENTILDIPMEWSNWLGAKVYPKSVLHPKSDEGTSNQIKKWPQYNGTRSNRMIRMLAVAAELDMGNKTNIDLINQIMLSAWQVLTKDTGILEQKANTLHYQLSRQAMAFDVIKEAWICPITHRLLDTTFKGITPYLPFNIENRTITCNRTVMPICNIDSSHFLSEKERLNAIRAWVNKSEEVAKLRVENLWTDISDKVVEGGSFFRAAEHSAQQPASKLKKYENLFKKGKLNVLSCSTTMEMGVDIGGISVVAMNNVPPHPANYLQRAGRAGRRSESQAVAFTICKDNPHERLVFRNPLWPFTTRIPVPYIVLNSAQIVQRHVNSLLLSFFLKNDPKIGNDKSIINLNCEWFFVGNEKEESQYVKMCRWLEVLVNVEIPHELENGIKSLIKGTVISSKPAPSLCDSALKSLKAIAEKWLLSYGQLQRQIEELSRIPEKDPYKRKMTYDLKRFGSEYLLSELASTAFLPGYGFPTGVVTFDNYSIHDYMKNRKLHGEANARVDNLTRMRERPARDMAVAIREYAPGADVVIDGLVYKSAGILLNPRIPDQDFSKPVAMSVEWRCHNCGSIGQSPSTLFKNQCIECDEELRADNIKEFIKPLGFSVDFYQSPTTDITVQSYIPVEEPWITANSELTALYNPLLGSYRNSTEGHIFHHSSGKNGAGYAICLQCGKAESMLRKDEYPKELQPGNDHKKLQGKAGSGDKAICAGSDSQYAIVKNIHLGASDQTDVFELYLKNPETNQYIHHKAGNPVLWTLAVALRQSLADIHGITSDEIGYTVKPVSLPGAVSASAIALYDRCGGGAGFSSAAPNHIQKMLRSAKEYLECPDNCDSACQACLLGYDTRFHESVLDRFKALEFLETLLNFIDMPEELKVFGDATEYCLNNLDAEILKKADQGYESISIFLQGDTNSWDLVESGVKGRVIGWMKYFSEVNIVMASSEKEFTDTKLKEDLAALKAIGANLSITTESNLPLAILKRNDQLLAYDIADDSLMNDPGSDFWNHQNLTLICGKPSHIPASTEYIVQPGFDMKLVQGDVEVEISSECDTQVIRFGLSLWNMLCKNNYKLDEYIKSGTKIKELSYTDAYICSPWSFLLYFAVIDGLKQKLKKAWGRPSILLTTSNKEANRKAKGLYSEWDDKKLQEEVFKMLFQELGEDLLVNFEDKKEMPHARSLDIKWETGEVTTVRLDHGMGYWSISSKEKIWFDTNYDAEKQIQLLAYALKNTSTKQGRNFPTQIFIKHR